jgi:signal peptidase I
MSTFRSNLYGSKQGKLFALTKGDNNEIDDRALYNEGYPFYQEWLGNEHLMGRVHGHFPYMGMLTILINDYPFLKFALIGSMAVFILATREN